MKSNPAEMDLKKMRQKYILWVLFCVIVFILFATQAFPSLYGDEYSSLVESKHVFANLHAVGYFVQLNLWDRLSDQDWFLRLLSIIWLGLGIYWLNKWLKLENLPTKTLNLMVLLVTLNSFLWLYGFQVRFYSYFFAASIFWVLRYRSWLAYPTRKNFLLLWLGLILLLTAHLFGVLVVATTLLSFLWDRLEKKHWYLFGVLFLVLVMTGLPPIRQVMVEIVYHMTNNPPPGETVSRGLSFAMLAKIPMTFYFFLMGERVYPLWWWVTVPSLLVVSIAFLLGVWSLRPFRGVYALAIFMLLNIPLLFLVLDPLAPPRLQGAVPRYVIFALPYFLLVLVLGAQHLKFLPHALIAVSLVGLFYTVWPQWSYGELDRMDWKKALTGAIREPHQSCVVMDGRSTGAVMRYSPVGTKIVRDDLSECLVFPRIVLVSNDHRLNMVRHFDEMEEQLSHGYVLVSNITLFPAQITVFDKSPIGNVGHILPARLDIPEQDLHFPLILSNRDWKIDGFMRMDEQTPEIKILGSAVTNDQLWVLTNFRADNSVDQGTPVFSLQFIAKDESVQEFELRAGEETSTWDGGCIQCLAVTQWKKKVHLVGAFSYPGAYRQYDVKIWGVKLKNIQSYAALKIAFLLPDGTGYFWGVYPDKNILP